MAQHKKHFDDRSNLIFVVISNLSLEDLFINPWFKTEAFLSKTESIGIFSNFSMVAIMQPLTQVQNNYFLNLISSPKLLDMSQDNKINANSFSWKIVNIFI